MNAPHNHSSAHWKQRARALGFDDCRVTSALPPDSAPRLLEWLREGCHGTMGWLERNSAKRVDPALVLGGAKSVLTLAASYFVEGVATAGKGGGIVARYARFPDYHDILADPLRRLADEMVEAGGGDTRALWYVDTGPILERSLAERAGLGFAGKHTNLINRRLGNWFFIAEIVSTLDLEPDEAEKNRCGTCERCIQACPTGAIPRPFHLDARRCISYLTIELKEAIPLELRPLIGNRVYGCDDCLAACPWNRFAREGGLMVARFKPELAEPNLLELLSLDQAGFKKMFGGTPMERTKRRGILRNACVALGNTAGAEALPALERAKSDPEPLVAEHAVWALGQIEQRLAETGRQPAS